MQIAMTVLFPLTFASNVFVDPDTMPGWVQAFVNVNPISFLATRHAGSCTVTLTPPPSAGCSCGRPPSSSCSPR